MASAPAVEPVARLLWDQVDIGSRARANRVPALATVDRQAHASSPLRLRSARMT